MKAEDFQPGENVLYVPLHAKGDTSHKDCERGVVVLTNELYVFVRYGDRTGSQATTPKDLVKIGTA